MAVYDRPCFQHGYARFVLRQPSNEVFREQSRIGHQKERTPVTYSSDRYGFPIQNGAELLHPVSQRCRLKPGGMISGGNLRSSFLRNNMATCGQIFNFPN